MNMLFTLSAQALDSSILEDVKFYVILALLAAALMTIIIIFAKWDKFKAKKQEEQKKVKTDQVEIIKIEDHKQNRIIGKDFEIEAQEVTVEE